MKVAIVVVDANDVSGALVRESNLPSPRVHPTMQALFDGLAARSDLECHVVYGHSGLNALESRRQGSVVYTGIPYSRARGMGGAFLGRFLALRRYIRQLRPDLVHGQGTERESGLVAAFSGSPSVLTLHGNFRELRKIYHAPLFSYYWMAAHLETFTLRRIDAIICISEYVREITRQFRAEKFLIPNAVQSQFLEAVRPFKTDGLRRVCCMGTIDRRKNTRFIVEACERLWNKGLEFELHIYGAPGQERDYFESVISKLRPWVEKGVAVYGGFAMDPVAIVAGMDIMVSASLEESFGMNVLEAMAAGTPAVGPRVGGIRDIIEEDKTGLFYDGNSLEDCAAQIERLLVDPKLWQSLSEQGRKRAGEKFAPEVIARETMDAYNKILQSVGKQDR